MKKQALICIDVQNDYFPGGAMELPFASDALKNITSVIQFCRERAIPLFHIYHENNHDQQKETSFLIKGTVGAEINPKVTPLKNEKVYRKEFPNSFLNTPLLHELRNENIEELIVVGMMTNMCIDSTVRAAFEYGFTVTILSDSCAAQAVRGKTRVISADIVHDAFIYWLSAVFCSAIETEKWMKMF